MNTRRAHILLWAIAVCLLSAFPVLAQEKTIATYGEPGEGKICVRVGAGYQYPGYYWVPAGTRLPDVIARAVLDRKARGNDPIVFVARIGKRGKEKTTFKSPIEESDAAASFVLEDGDEVRTAIIQF